MKKLIIAITAMVLSYGAFAQKDTMPNNNGDINGASQGTMPNNNVQNNGMKPDKMGDAMHMDKMHYKSMDHKMANMSHEKMVMMQDGKVVIMRNGIMKTVMNYTPLSNGTKVMSDGTVMKKDGTQMMLKEGEHINMAGEIMPKM